MDASLHAGVPIKTIETIVAATPATARSAAKKYKNNLSASIVLFCLGVLLVSGKECIILFLPSPFLKPPAGEPFVASFAYNFRKVG